MSRAARDMNVLRKGMNLGLQGSDGAGSLNRGQKAIPGKPEATNQDTSKFLSLSPVPVKPCDVKPQLDMVQREP